MTAVEVRSVCVYFIFVSYVFCLFRNSYDIISSSLNGVLLCKTDCFNCLSVGTGMFSLSALLL